jgi:sec-independent protein translocase protein TatC
MSEPSSSSGSGDSGEVPALVREEPGGGRVAGEMSLLEHLEELRGVLVKSLVALVIGCCVSGALYGPISEALQYPLMEALELDKPEELTRFLNTLTPYAVFSLLLQIVVFGGAALASPFILFFAGTFFYPALTPAEKKVLVPGILAGTLLFVLGAVFAYFGLLPLSLQFSLYLNEQMGLGMVWNALSYYSGVILLTLGMGALFEFPLLLVILQYLEVISPEQLKRGWRWAVIIILVVAAVLTPADIASMVVAAIPLTGLYVGSIVVGQWVLRLKRRREARDAAYADEDETG